MYCLKYYQYPLLIWKLFNNTDRKISQFRLYLKFNFLFSLTPRKQPVYLSFLSDCCILTSVQSGTSIVKMFHRLTQSVGLSQHAVTFSMYCETASLACSLKNKNNMFFWKQKLVSLLVETILIRSIVLKCGSERFGSWTRIKCFVLNPTLINTNPTVMYCIV